MYVYIKLKNLYNVYIYYAIIVIQSQNSYIILADRNNENLVELIDSLVSWRS